MTHPPHDSIACFVERLARTPCGPSACNQYAHDDPANAVRRANLTLYLSQMHELRPHVMLVGEAPGYRGCRLTGVPFTSEYIIVAGVEQASLFGEHRGYSISGESARPSREQTATLMWQGLSSLPTAPLLWNAYPFHPFKATDPLSNRVPNAEERAAGAAILRRLIDIFCIEQTVAVGNVAEASLLALGLACSKIRHPANGGKSAFLAGLSALGLGCVGPKSYYSGTQTEIRIE